MAKTRLLIFFVVLSGNFSNSQSKPEIDSLLDGIARIENSKEITKTEQAEKILAFGESSLTILAEFFIDSTKTVVRSECQERNLTKGELAIIMADRIEIMPYATITGIQNCLLTYCENNPNIVEYYLWAIKRDGYDNFQKKYVDWIYSKDRLDWPIKLKGKARKERKKQIRNAN
ncbi:hypothetical protein GGR42_003410 [Saonia flava]|uniref:Uncharacterized protein n=1 Tax=Saonia flava TaxID=523696 RepID=A0A846R1R9_9FLAO|nr:hypothetical protein [Saonia flava]NJB72912.1 hypothetical protein [Saonia flava]